MSHREVTFVDREWDAGGVRVPVRVIRAAQGEAGPPVLLLHGLGAGKAVQDKEGASLARAGLTAVVVDAPHHGARRSALLDEMDAARGAAAHELLLRMVREATAEIPALVERTVRDLGGPVGVLGISMGAFTALAATVAEPRLAVTVSILGSPDWMPPSGETTPAIVEWATEAPVHRAEAFPPRPLFLANAGLDTSVPPAATRAFAAAMRPRYAADPERLVYAEYPRSPHFMREEDWDEAWGRALGFLRRFLTVAPAAAGRHSTGP